MSTRAAVKEDQVMLNGISFTSEDYNQRYFDRKRVPRLEKKLSVGSHLTLVVSYIATLSVGDLKEKYGEDWLEAMEDRVFDLSYEDVANSRRSRCHWLGFMSMSCDREKEIINHYSAWEIPSPDAETFRRCTKKLESALRDVLGEDIKVDEVIFING